MTTVKDYIDYAIGMIDEHRITATAGPAREFALAVTALEDAQMRYTRGRAKEEGCFGPTDIDKGVG